MIIKKKRELGSHFEKEYLKTGKTFIKLLAFVIGNCFMLNRVTILCEKFKRVS